MTPVFARGDVFCLAILTRHGGHRVEQAGAAVLADLIAGNCAADEARFVGVAPVKHDPDPARVALPAAHRAADHLNAAVPRDPV